MIEEIEAICVEDYYCIFHFDDKEKFGCTLALNKIENILPAHFLKISRSNIIHIQKLDSIYPPKQEVKLKSGLKVHYTNDKFVMLKHILEEKSTINFTKKRKKTK
jgi:DNA-binding LytR/AlgR family response regulator